MGHSKRTGLRYADLPTVDTARIEGNVAATRAMDQMRQILQVRFGAGGSQLDRAVTFGDLVENGLAKLRLPNGQLVSVDPGGDIQPPGTPVIDGIPPAPTGLTVSPGLGVVILEWDRPTFSYFGYAEIFRNTEDNQATAVKIGETSAWIYADNIEAAGTEYFYWVRFISMGGKVGPFNALSGTPGDASLDPAYLIQVLSSDNPGALLYKIPEDTTINGVFVPAGIYIVDAYIANGSISTAKIGNAVITDAKVANLSAAKVTFGVMSGDRIEVGSLNANRLNTATLVTTLALINQAYVGTANIDDATITTAKIVDLNVTRAKIANLAVGTAQIDDLAVTNAKIGNAAITAAKIGNAEIQNAHIQNAAVDRLKVAGTAVTTSAAYDFGYMSGQVWDGNWRTRGTGTILVPENATLMVTMQHYFDQGLTARFTGDDSWGPDLRRFDYRVLVNGIDYGVTEIPVTVRTTGHVDASEGGTPPFIVDWYDVTPLFGFSFNWMCFGVAGSLTVTLQYRLRNEFTTTRNYNTSCKLFMLTAYR